MKQGKSERMIKLTYQGSTFQVPSGITVEDCLIRCFGLDTEQLNYIDNPVVAIRADNELLPFSARLKTDVVLEFQLLFSNLGKRMYRHTMSYLLAMASRQLFPERRLVIGHSLGDGYYFTYEDIYAIEQKDIVALRECMQDLVRQNLVIEREVLSYRDALAYFNKVGFSATATLLTYRNDPTLTLYRCANYLDISYEPLLPRTSLVSLWDLRQYGDRGLLLRYPHSKNYLHMDAFKDNPLLFSVFREYKMWGNILKVDCLGAMNAICGSNEIATFIRMNEDLQHRKISETADYVVEKGAVKVVFIAGPSSSGKTTFSKRLALQLRLLGHDPVQISLDNYYRPKSEAPKDENGNPDLEALEALDLDLFRQNLHDLYTGKTVELPRFDFKGNGKRYWTGETLTLKESTILVIEGIHGLNPALIPNIDRKTTFKIYISALTQLNLDDHNRISTTDNRIIRRIVRDNRTRGTSAETTLLMWPSVERGEAHHIFPYQNQADIMINSALEYELAVLKPYAEPLLKTVKPDSHDAYPIARRLLAFLENVYPIPADHVPTDSLLREFIGGSEFNAT